MKLYIALLFITLFLALSVEGRRCFNKTSCRTVRKCRNLRYPYQVRRRTLRVRHVTRYRYVRVRQTRRVCYMKKVKQRYSFLTYYNKRVSYRQSYFAKQRYKAWFYYRTKQRRTRSVKYRKFYNAKIRVRTIVRRRRRVRRTRIVVKPRRCRKPFWKFYSVYVRRPYKSYCSRRQQYLKTVRYLSTCPYKVKVAYYTNQMVPHGNCYRRKVAFKWVVRYKRCYKNKKVKAWRNVRYRCTRYRRVKVRRKKLVYRWGSWCKKQVKVHYFVFVYYNSVVYVTRVVRRWRWAKRTVVYYVSVVKRRTVTRVRTVIRYRTAVKIVRATKRVTRFRWWSVPAFRNATYYIKVLRSYRVRVKYWYYYTVRLTRTRKVCVNKRLCVTRRVCQ